MAQTYKLTVAGIKPTFENGQAYMVRTNRGDLWMRYIGESASDDKPIFLTEGLDQGDLMGSTVYDKYAQASRVLFASTVIVRGYENIGGGFSGAVHSGKAHEYDSFSGASGVRPRVKQAAKPSNERYSSYSRNTRGTDETLQKMKDRAKKGAWKIAAITVAAWAALYALTGTHAGLALGMPLAFLGVTMWPEIQEWLKQDIRENKK